MVRYNLILGALFGILVVIAGPIGEPYAKMKFSDDLKEKAVMVAGPPLADGSPGPAVMEISTVDRQESAQRWQSYQDGLRYVAFHALALAALGLASQGGWGQVIGGVGFSLGTLLFGCGTTVAAVLDAPTFAVYSSVGAMFLLAGWIGLFITAVTFRPAPKGS